MQTRKILLRLLWLFLKILTAAAVMIAIYRFGGYAYQFGHSIYDNSSVSEPPGRDVALVLPEGTTVRQVAELLEAKGLIKDAAVFLVQERLSKYHGQMQAGNYVLNTSQSAQEILAVLSGNEEDVAETEEE